MNEHARMTQVARWHTFFGLCFGILGMALGIYMAASHHHEQHVTHAHILLLGLVVSLLYGMVYRLWIAEGIGFVAMLQMALHQAGTLVLTVSLFLLFGNVRPPASLEPALGLGALAVFGGALLMLYQFVRADRRARANGRGAVMAGSPS